MLPQIDQARIKGRSYWAGVSRRLDLSAARRIARTVEQEEIDVLVCTNSFSLLYGWLACRFSRVRPKLIEVFHTTDLGSWKHKLQMVFYRPFFGAADEVIFVCETQRRHWQKNALKMRSSRVIYNGIDVDHFVDCFSDKQKAELRHQYGLASEDYVVGICAAMRPEKAHADLLAAAKLLKAEGCSIKCLLIGDGPERRKIEARITSLGLNSDVKVTGFISDVRLAIAACDVMVLVSHHETFSISALEGMALGKPIVMSNIGGASEQITDGKNGKLFAAGDVGGLSKALGELQRKDKRNAMGVHARNSVIERFSQKKMVGSFERLFESFFPIIEKK
jgi:glycosyltransferase involved in cell wall biosynthesis